MSIRIGVVGLLSVCFMGLFCDEQQPYTARYYGQFPERLERTIGKKPAAYVQVKTERVFLLHGKVGVGLCMTARVYAEKLGAHFKEVPFSVLLDGYKRFGVSYIHDFFKQVQQDAVDKKQNILLYISDIDGGITKLKLLPFSEKEVPNKVSLSIEPFNLNTCKDEKEQQELARNSQSPEVKAVLDQIRIELQDLEDSECKDCAVFVVLSTHMLEDVDPAFVRRSAVIPIKITNDIMSRCRIFHANLFAEYEVSEAFTRCEALSDKLAKDNKIAPLVAKTDELRQLVTVQKTRIVTFWEQYIIHQTCWLTHDVYREAKKELLRCLADIDAKADQLIAMSDAALKECEQSACDKGLERDYCYGVTYLGSLLKASVRASMQVYVDEKILVKLFTCINLDKVSNRAVASLAKEFCECAETAHRKSLNKNVVQR